MANPIERLEQLLQAQAAQIENLRAALPVPAQPAQPADAQAQANAQLALEARRDTVIALLRAHQTSIYSINNADLQQILWLVREFPEHNPILDIPRIVQKVRALPVTNNSMRINEASNLKEIVFSDGNVGNVTTL